MKIEKPQDDWYDGITGYLREIVSEDTCLLIIVEKLIIRISSSLIYQPSCFWQQDKFVLNMCCYLGENTCIISHILYNYQGR